MRCLHRFGPQRGCDPGSKNEDRSSHNPSCFGRSEGFDASETDHKQSDKETGRNRRQPGEQERARGPNKVSQVEALGPVRGTCTASHERTEAARQGVGQSQRSNGNPDHRHGYRECQDKSHPASQRSSQPTPHQHAETSQPGETLSSDALGRALSPKRATAVIARAQSSIRAFQERAALLFRSLLPHSIGPGRPQVEIVVGSLPTGPKRPRLPTRSRRGRTTTGGG